MIFLRYIITIFFLASCTNKPIVIQSQKSQLELREMQSASVESTDMKHILGIIIQVLQDDEYTIDNLDSDIGYFSAEKKLDGGKEEYQFEIFDIYYPYALYKLKNLDRFIIEVKATISVRVQQNNSQIRASFISNMIDEEGKIKSVKTIDDPKFYQEFFLKINKGLFLQKHNL
ncbi:MAG: hypothetical protein OEV64_06530 [Desulfobulbaceae bacterium]|nr:hypothetical protein [Desulfobulbaceae bacterium]